MNGAALAARDDMAELVTVFARGVGVKEGESTLSVFLGLHNCLRSAVVRLHCSEKNRYRGAALSRRRLWIGLFRVLSQKIQSADRHWRAIRLVTSGFPR